MFKKVFTSVGNERILKGFVEDILGQEFKSLQTRETYNIHKIDPDKITRTEVDVLAQTSTGEYITIEMQVRNHRSFIERALYYLFQKYTDQYQNKDNQSPYNHLKKTYGINITKFNLFEHESDPVRHFILKDRENNRPLVDYDTKDVQLTFFSLTNNNHTAPNIKYWQAFFEGNPIPDEAPDYIHQADQLIQFENLSEEERTMAEMMSKAEAIDLAEKEYVFDKGVEQGQDLMIIKMLKNGATITTIANLTGYSEDKINEIIRKNDE